MINKISVIFPVALVTILLYAVCSCEEPAQYSGPVIPIEVDTNVSSNSIELTWTKNENEATNWYFVQHVRQDTNNWETKVVIQYDGFTNPNFSYLLENLDTNTTYLIRVFGKENRSDDDDHLTANSDTLKVTTLKLVDGD